MLTRDGPRRSERARSSMAVARGSPTPRFHPGQGGFRGAANPLPRARDSPLAARCRPRRTVRPIALRLPVLGALLVLDAGRPPTRVRSMCHLHSLRCPHPADSHRSPAQNLAAPLHALRKGITVRTRLARARDRTRRPRRMVAPLPGRWLRQVVRWVAQRTPMRSARSFAYRPEAKVVHGR
jgi:hypothetical protein